MFLPCGLTLTIELIYLWLVKLKVLESKYVGGLRDQRMVSMLENG